MTPSRMGDVADERTTEEVTPSRKGEVAEEGMTKKVAPLEMGDVVEEGTTEGMASPKDVVVLETEEVASPRDQKGGKAGVGGGCRDRGGEDADLD